MNGDLDLAEKLAVLNDGAAEPGMSRAAMMGVMQDMSESLQVTNDVTDEISAQIESIDARIEEIEAKVRSIDEEGKKSRIIAIATLVFAILTFIATIGPNAIELFRFVFVS